MLQNAQIQKASNLLVIISKFPAPGNVKTRLAKALGAENAASVMEALLVDLLTVHVTAEYDLLVCAPFKDMIYQHRFRQLLPDILIEYRGNELRGKNSQLWQVFKTQIERFLFIVSVTMPKFII